jgi:hypothetical protein
MRTTPTATMEIMLNLPPLHFFIEMEATRTLCRIKLVLGRKVQTKRIPLPVLLVGH